MTNEAAVVMQVAPARDAWSEGVGWSRGGWQQLEYNSWKDQWSAGWDEPCCQGTAVCFAVTSTTTDLGQPVHLWPSSTHSGREPLGIFRMAFYRLVVLSVTQPSVSKHWKQRIALTLTSGLASSVLHPPLESWQKGHWFFFLWLSDAVWVWLAIIRW